MFNIFNVYETAYGSLSKGASANPAIKLDYVNGHFGYFYKFGIAVNQTHQANLLFERVLDRLWLNSCTSA